MLYILPDLLIFLYECVITGDAEAEVLFWPLKKTPTFLLSVESGSYLLLLLCTDIFN